MNKIFSAIWVGFGIALVLGGIHLAEARSHAGYQSRNEAARQEFRRNWREIQKDRAELRRDLAGLHADRRELRKTIRRGASKEVVASRRAEIRQDMKAIREDRREIRERYTNLRGDLYGHGWRGSSARRDHRDGFGGNRHGWGAPGRYGWRDYSRHNHWRRGLYHR